MLGRSPGAGKSAMSGAWAEQRTSPGRSHGFARAAIATGGDLRGVSSWHGRSAGSRGAWPSPHHSVDGSPGARERARPARGPVVLGLETARGRDAPRSPTDPAQPSPPALGSSRHPDRPPAAAGASGSRRLTDTAERPGVHERDGRVMARPASYRRRGTLLWERTEGGRPGSARRADAPTTRTRAVVARCRATRDADYCSECSPAPDELRLCGPDSTKWATCRPAHRPRRSDHVLRSSSASSVVSAGENGHAPYTALRSAASDSLRSGGRARPPARAHWIIGLWAACPGTPHRSKSSVLWGSLVMSLVFLRRGGLLFSSRFSFLTFISPRNLPSTVVSLRW